MSHPLHGEIAELFNEVGKAIGDVLEKRANEGKTNDGVILAEAMLMHILDLYKSPVTRQLDGNPTEEVKKEVHEFGKHVLQVKDTHAKLYSMLGVMEVPSAAVLTAAVSELIDVSHDLNHKIYDDKHGTDSSHEPEPTNTSTDDIRSFIKGL